MQLEVGDMILWVTDMIGGLTNDEDAPDTGWVVHVEKRHRKPWGDDLKEHVVVYWLSSNSAEEHWTDYLLNENCKIIKGGQHDR